MQMLQSKTLFLNWTEKWIWDFNMIFGEARVDLGHGLTFHSNIVLTNELLLKLVFKLVQSQGKSLTRLIWWTTSRQVCSQEMVSIFSTLPKACLPMSKTSGNSSSVIILENDSLSNMRLVTSRSIHRAMNLQYTRFLDVNMEFANSKQTILTSYPTISVTRYFHTK